MKLKKGGITIELMLNVLNVDLVQYDHDNNVVQYYNENLDTSTKKRKYKGIWVDMSMADFANFCKLWALKYGYVFKSFCVTENKAICEVYSLHDLNGKTYDVQQCTHEHETIIECAENLLMFVLKQQLYKPTSDNNKDTK